MKTKIKNAKGFFSKFLVFGLALLLILIVVLRMPNQNNVFGFVMEEIFLPLVQKNYQPPALIYESANLQGHSIFAECNPGNTTSCPCSDDEAALISHAGYGEVIANPNQIHTFVNAIGFKKFTEVFPNGDQIQTGIYLYQGEFRLPVLPKPDLTQITNPQAIHLMIQFWDGRNELINSNKTTREGVIFWELNPWDGSNYGKIKIYVNPLNLIETGIEITPDTEWHTFELRIDLQNHEYVSIQIDDQFVDLRGNELGRVYHADWGTDISLSITTESMNSYPGESCDHVFTWTTEFRNLSFYLIQ